MARHTRGARAPRGRRRAAGGLGRAAAAQGGPRPVLDADREPRLVWVGRTRRWASGCRRRSRSPTSWRRRRASTPSRARAATCCSGAASSDEPAPAVRPAVEPRRLRGVVRGCLWAVTSPLGALLFAGARQSVPWFVAFAGLVALSGAIDPALAAARPTSPTAWSWRSSRSTSSGVAATAYALLQYFVARAASAQHRALELEQASPSGCC